MENYHTYILEKIVEGGWKIRKFNDFQFNSLIFTNDILKSIYNIYFKKDNSSIQNSYVLDIKQIKDFKTDDTKSVESNTMVYNPKISYIDDSNIILKKLKKYVILEDELFTDLNKNKETYLLFIKDVIPLEMILNDNFISHNKDITKDKIIEILCNFSNVINNQLTELEISLKKIHKKFDEAIEESDVQSSNKLPPSFPVGKYRGDNSKTDCSHTNSISATDLKTHNLPLVQNLNCMGSLLSTGNGLNNNVHVCIFKKNNAHLINDIKLNKRLKIMTKKEKEFITTLFDFELYFIEKNITKYKTLIDNFIKDTFYETFEMFKIDINEYLSDLHNSSEYITYTLKNNYIFDNEKKNKKKFTDIYLSLLKILDVNESGDSKIKYKLPEILKNIGLSKCRASDGMYWYGITENKKSTIYVDSFILDGDAINCEQYSKHIDYVDNLYKNLKKGFGDE